MPNLGQELHFWRLEGVGLGDDDVNLEHASVVHGALGSLDLAEKMAVAAGARHYAGADATGVVLRHLCQLLQYAPFCLRRHRLYGIL